MSQSESGSPINVEELNQLSKAELVQIILTQQKLIEQLRQEIEKLKRLSGFRLSNLIKTPINRFIEKVGKA